MGRALVRDPPIFLFDEPLSNLDAKLRVQMRSEIKALHHKIGTTCLYVTHDQIEAMTLADRMVVLHDGAVEQSGPPLMLYDRPANLFVAWFLGSPAMNFIKGRLISDGAPKFLSEGGLAIPLASLPQAAAGAPVVCGFHSRGGRSRRPVRRFMMRVKLIEPTGAETPVHAELGRSRHHRGRSRNASPSPPARRSASPFRPSKSTSSTPRRPRG